MQVNHALGDYLNLGPTAQALRGAIPFIAWYRAILTITGHLAFDTPGRADIFQQLGQLGAKRLNRSFRRFMAEPTTCRRGYWAMWPLATRGRVLGTTGLNPFQTINQLGSAASGLVAGRPAAAGQAISNLGLNPFLQGALNYACGKNLFTGKTLNTPGGIVGSVLDQTATGLPQVTSLAKAILGHGTVTETYGRLRPPKVRLSNFSAWR